MTSKKKKDMKDHPLLYVAKHNFQDDWNIQKTFIIKPKKKINNEYEEGVPNQQNDTPDLIKELQSAEKAEATEEDSQKEVQLEDEGSDVMQEEIEKEVQLEDEGSDVMQEEVEKEVTLDAEEPEVIQEDVENFKETREVAEIQEQLETSKEAVQLEDDVEEGGTTPISENWRKKSFKEMNHTEKIYFLLQRPHYIKSIKCKIQTEKESFVGYVLSYEDGYVKIKITNRTMSTEVTVKFEDIVSIRMVGF
ncbi:CotO family spore coat protein [Bacillus mycoides]|uniref:CotO family spore coat protein n=1 Tax=Bacillus mycoides TaxID=1405 RepID=UPI00119E7195|nr:CotO family spore coat protein [Bacillus mycoides]